MCEVSLFDSLSRISLGDFEVDPLAKEEEVMMFFWIREIAGWALVIFSLYLMRVAIVFVTDIETPKIVESWRMMLAGLGVLRAGVLLIRVSTAARLCRMEVGTNSKK